MALTVLWDRQHIGLLHCKSGLLLLNKIQDMIQNVNTSFVIFKTIQHVKSWYWSDHPGLKADIKLLPWPWNPRKLTQKSSTYWWQKLPFWFWKLSTKQNSAALVIYIFIYFLSYLVSYCWARTPTFFFNLNIIDQPAPPLTNTPTLCLNDMPIDEYIYTLIM